MLKFLVFSLFLFVVSCGQSQNQSETQAANLPDSPPLCSVDYGAELFRSEACFDRVSSIDNFQSAVNDELLFINELRVEVDLSANLQLGYYCPVAQESQDNSPIFFQLGKGEKISQDDAINYLWTVFPQNSDGNTDETKSPFNFKITYLRQDKIERKMPAGNWIASITYGRPGEDNEEARCVFPDASPKTFQVSEASHLLPEPLEFDENITSQFDSLVNEVDTLYEQLNLQQCNRTSIALLSERFSEGFEKYHSPETYTDRDIKEALRQMDNRLDSLRNSLESCKTGDHSRQSELDEYIRDVNNIMKIEGEIVDINQN